MNNKESIRINNYDPFKFRDYVQSSNALFHFMDKASYLKDILLSGVIVPRFCIENIDYLNLVINGVRYKEIAVLQKCFCDIPFHKLMDTFNIEIVEEPDKVLSENKKNELKNRNTHPDLYGGYAIALSKSWGESNNLLPIQYVNENSAHVKSLSDLIQSLYDLNDLPDILYEDIIRHLSFLKPIRGLMDRKFNLESGETDVVKIRKNFHDEREWRYVPTKDLMNGISFDCIIINPSIIENMQNINNVISKDLQYKKLWLEYDYNDVRYIVVPDAGARLDIIDAILKIPDSKFKNCEQIDQMKYILISKILVIDEVRGDW